MTITHHRSPPVLKLHTTLDHVPHEPVLLREAPLELLHLRAHARVLALELHDVRRELVLPLHHARDLRRERVVPRGVRAQRGRGGAVRLARAGDFALDVLERVVRVRAEVGVAEGPGLVGKYKVLMRGGRGRGGRGTYVVVGRLVVVDSYLEERERVRCVRDRGQFCMGAQTERAVVFQHTHGQLSSPQCDSNSEGRTGFF